MKKATAVEVGSSHDYRARNCNKGADISQIKYIFSRMLPIKVT